MSSLVVTSMVAGCSTAPMSPEVSREVAQSRPRPRPGYNGKYDGPPPTFKRDQWERRPVGFSYCRKYDNATIKHVQVCGDAVEEARAMASKYATLHGREDGYMRGYSWGLSQAINYYQNSEDEMLRGEAEVNSLNGKLSFAETEGSNAGSRDGNSLGTSEAQGRFYAAVDTGKLPSPTPTIPQTNFIPTQDAYRTYYGDIPTPEEILKRDRYGRIGFYDNYDRNYGGGRDWRERNPRDLWSRNGDYNYDSNAWINGEFAFQRWLEIGGSSRQRYNSYVYFDAQEEGRMPAQQRGDDNHPQRPRPGQPGQQPQPPAQPQQPQAPATPTTPATPPAPPVDYQAIFRDAFVQTYAAYAPSEYSQSYNSMIDDGQRDGEQVGYDVGSEIAQRKGMARAFNRNFYSLSYNTYQKVFANTYRMSFDSAYNDFKNRSVLTYNFMGLIGADDDGVIQPGEAFAVKFKVTNAGGQASPLKYTVSGDVTDAQTFTDSISAISSKVIVSKNIGEVLNTLEDNSNVNYVLNINGARENLWQPIKRPLSLGEPAGNLSALDGSGIYNVVITNISTVALNGAISLELKINGVTQKTVIGAPMQPGEKKSFALDFSKIDPINWITKGFSAELLLKYNNTLFSKRAFNVSVTDTVDMMAQYYTRLINEKGFVPAGMDLSNRITEVKNFIIEKNLAEVNYYAKDGDNVYRTAPDTTVPGKVLKARTAYPDNSSRAKGEFTNIADAFYKEAGKFKSGLFGLIQPKKDHYLDLLKKIGDKKYK